MTKNQGGELSPTIKKGLKDLKQETREDLKELGNKLIKELTSKGDLKDLKKENDKALKELRYKLKEELAGKEDLDKVILSLLATQSDVKELKSGLKETNETVNKILTVVDGIAKNFKKTDEELTANQDAHNRMQKEINQTRTKVGLKVKSVVQ